jgi:mono/diheme cytochrome c family protein
MNIAMVVNIAISVILLVLAVLLGWLAFRASHARNAFVKWGGGILSSLLTLAVAAVVVLAWVALAKLYVPRTAPASDLKVEGTPEQVERGRYLANSLCVECHSISAELPLTGGVDFAKEIPLPVGVIVSANLTPAGPLKDWSDGEIFRALRTGIDRDGHHLILMSAVPVRNMSDEDLRAVIAFLRSQPAVVHDTPNPPDQPSFLATLMFGAGMIPGGQPPVAGEIVAPAKGPTTEYGQYLVGFVGCRDCHGENLTGKESRGFGPSGPSLRVVKGWTAEQFLTTLRTGVDPGGHQLAASMPWKVVSRMDDGDLAAIYQYLASLP